MTIVTASQTQYYQQPFHSSPTSTVDPFAMIDDAFNAFCSAMPSDWIVKHSDRQRQTSFSGSARTRLQLRFPEAEHPDPASKYSSVLWDRYYYSNSPNGPSYGDTLIYDWSDSTANNGYGQWSSNGYTTGMSYPHLGNPSSTYPEIQRKIWYSIDDELPWLVFHEQHAVTSKLWVLARMDTSASAIGAINSINYPERVSKWVILQMEQNGIGYNSTGYVCVPHGYNDSTSDVEWGPYGTNESGGGYNSQSMERAGFTFFPGSASAYHGCVIPFKGPMWGGHHWLGTIQPDLMLIHRNMPPRRSFTYGGKTYFAAMPSLAFKTSD